MGGILHHRGIAEANVEFAVGRVTVSFGDDPCLRDDVEICAVA
jgi:hypothetical protein